ncbi:MULTISPECIES: hypothetical protein [Methylocystis]|uniref:Uncharacterized protein n=1 Tax=Methylocystis iwaonis TaxID=2885079 RepID=A0ABM8E5Q8_9HYPH|nr:MULTISPECIES: hypothetical protein [Methylocystis]MBL1257517.1 hypothetical protein [Methylocystis sp. Sn-Cys]MDJ0449094.1 hypothetical protein [Methylocystis sp. JR02]BDV33303.1 hypothetical protein SS37A_08320 [Methylocystis iwaonis]
MKTKIVSGAALAAAAVGLALSGAVVTPAAAHGSHLCNMSKGQCGGKTACMTKTGVCKHNVGKSKASCRHGCHHKSSCHHSKGACNMKSKCHTK